MEAIDQPWKEGIGGRVEAYWGVFNASRQPKFSFTGTVIEDPIWPWKAGVASLIALLPMFWFARHFIRFRAMMPGPVRADECDGFAGNRASGRIGCAPRH